MSQAGASPDQSSELPGAVCPETHKRPLAVVAHRGASGTHPENTAVAFAEAVRLGVESIELDVHRSAATTIPENIQYNTVLPFHPGAARWYEENGYEIDPSMIKQ